MHAAFAIPLGIGIVAGLRSLTAPAAVAWAAYLGWIDLSGTPLAFIGSILTAGLFTLLALLELVGDKLPTTPNRTSAVPLTARILMGGLSGACLAVAAGASLATGAALGALGGVIGAFCGYQVRTRLTRALGGKGLIVALSEDLTAITFAYLLVSRA